MFKIGSFTSENNPCGRGVQVTTKIDTWTSTVARTGILASAGVVADRVAVWPRRICDHLFTLNDIEACWRDWQVTRVHGGLGRRYRDPAFDTLVSCAQCQGTGLEIVEIIEMDMPCGICYGVGRLTITGAGPGG